MRECWWLLRQSLVQFLRSVQKRVDGGPHRRQEDGQVFARPRDLAYLHREVVTLQRAGGLRRETMQGVESHPDALEAPAHAAVRAAQVFGERRAGQSWIEHDSIFSDVGQ